MNSIHSLLLIALAATSLSSCVVSEYPGGPVVSIPTNITFGTYDTLPGTFVGDAYYYQNRYYYGGTYQRGSYHYQGRTYTDRYYHGGQYFYGGRHEQHDRRPAQRTGNNDYHGDRSDRIDRSDRGGRDNDYRGGHGRN